MCGVHVNRIVASSCGNMVMIYVISAAYTLLRRSRGDNSPRRSTSHGCPRPLANGCSHVVAMLVCVPMEATIGAQGSTCPAFALRQCIGAVRTTWRREQQHKVAVINIMRILASLSRIPVRNAILAGTPSSRLCVECPKAPAVSSICCCLPCSVQFRCLAGCLTELLLRSPRRVGRG